MKVVILAGGRSSERDVSLSTATVLHAALTTGGHEVHTVTIDRSGRWHRDGQRIALFPGDGLLGCDVVFPALHGPFGEDGTLQGLLELLDVPYVGAGVLASALCMDKGAFKQALAATDVPQVAYAAVQEQRWRRSPERVEALIGELGWPVFVTPSRLGSSVGIVRVQGPESLKQAMETAFSHDGMAVVEQYSPGIEVECGVIGLSDPETSAAGQVVLAHGDWYDQRAKSTRRGHALRAPAPLAAARSTEVRRLARETFLRLGCAGMARVAFFVEEDRVLVHGVTTLPGFAPTCDFPALWETSGLSLPALCDRLLGYALERFRTERGVHAV